MPPLLPFVPLIAAGIGAAGTGLSIDEAINAPSAPKISATPPPLTGPQNAQTTAAVGQQLPTLQSLTGGSLSPEYASQFGATQGGAANNPQATGDIQAAINQYYGLTSPGQTGLNPTGSTPNSGTPGILDILSKPPGSTGQPGGNGIQNWVQRQLNGNQFQGLQA